MLNSLAVAAALLLAPGDLDLTVPQNPKAVPVLKTWLKQYRSGKIDVGNIDRNIAGKSTAKKAGLVSKKDFEERGGKFSYREEIKVLLEATTKVNTAKARLVADVSARLTLWAQPASEALAALEKKGDE